MRVKNVKRRAPTISERDFGNLRDVHEQLLIGITLQLGLVVQSLSPSLLNNSSSTILGCLCLNF
jgi:hypothetical protein